MFMKLFVIHCLTASCFAWLAPERCAQNTKTKRNVQISTPKSAELVSDISEIATKQHDKLIEAYKNHQFIGVPTMRKCDPFVTNPERFELHAPYNCSFHTYDPRLLSSVTCRRAACKLSHTVSTVDTYTASEGYNWGVKISTKATFYKVIEAGGEVSTGGTYSCTYTKGKTISDLVECSDSSGENGDLQLFSVKSDMMCDFGQIKYEKESRDGKYYATISIDGVLDMLDMMILRSMTSEGTCWKMIATDINDMLGNYVFALDSDRITDRLVEKLKKADPLYNPLTDLIFVGYFSLDIKIYYFKRTTAVQDYTRIIPFTNENGDSVSQYACIKTPS